MATSKTTDTPAKKTTTAKKAATKTTTSKTDKPATTRKKTVKPAIITSEERYKMIEVAAYYIAEKSGFVNDNMYYWLQAEQEVDAKLTA